MGNSGAVVLAAGYSSRMGTFKPLLDIGGSSVIERVIHSLRQAGVSEIAVVTGHQREQLLPVLQGLHVREAYNEAYSQGMFSSIQTGIRIIAALGASRLDGLLLLPADYAAVDGNVIRKILKEAQGHQRFVVPCYHGKKGHPLWIPSWYWEEILSYEGTKGLKGITEKYGEEMEYLETGRESVVLDMDDKQGYERLLAYWKGGCKEEALSMLAKDRRIFLIRHGQIQQHKSKIFLGQKDVPLSSLGKEQASAAAGRLRGYDPQTNVIYASDLSRARESAEIIARELNFRQVACRKDLREMALGEWDGKDMDDIRRQYPMEFEERGRNLLGYKVGHDMENFYDLHYRAVRALKEILKQDLHKDIILVIHGGIIRTLLAALREVELSMDIFDETIEVGSVRKIQL